jgi:hypothetical protein
METWLEQQGSSPILKKALSQTTSSLAFVNLLLGSVLDSEKRFSIAIEFIALHNAGYEGDSFLSDCSLWVIIPSPSDDFTLVEYLEESLISPLPNQWLPTEELHQKYIQKISAQSKKTISLHPRFMTALQEFRFTSLKSDLLRGSFKLLISSLCRHTKSEREALEFAGSMHRPHVCTGWGSKRGYTLRDWTLTTFSREIKEDLLPYLLDLIRDELDKTFYRSADTQGYPREHRVSQWVTEVASSLPQWIRSPPLKDLCNLLMKVCSKDESLLSLSHIHQSISETSGDRVPLPPLDELRRRDEVLRHMFTNRNWGSNAEYRLKRSFVLSSSTLLPDYPLLIDDEWEVVANRSDLGRGDLLFCSADGAQVAVVELKANSSSTAESVKEQARKYASAYYELYQVTGVRAYIVRSTSSNLSAAPLPEQVCDFGTSKRTKVYLDLY